MYKSQSKPLTVNEIFEAYNTHKENFLILDIFSDNTGKDKKDKLRSNAAGSVQYGDVLVKKADGSEVPLVVKFIQLATLGRIKEPKERDYESLKLSFRKNDKINVNSRFGEAMDLICKTFEKKVNDFTINGDISIKPKAKSGSLKVHSTTPTFPIQYEVENRESGQVEELDNPIMWFEIKSKYYKPDELEKLEHYNGLSYNKDQKPVLKKDFSVKICDLSKKRDEEIVRVDSRTRKEIIKTVSHIPIATDSNDETLNNCNIQEFITPGSAVSGFVEMQLTISGRAFNLKTTFKNNSNLYIYPVQNNNININQELDTEEVDEMIPQTNNLSNLNINSDKEDKEDKEDKDDDEDNDDDDEEDDDFTSKLESIGDE
jgi:hypothetical protein